MGIPHSPTSYSPTYQPPSYQPPSYQPPSYQPPQPKSIEEIKAEAQQFQIDNPGWGADVDDHGTTYYVNPYINDGRGNTQKPTPDVIEAAKAAKAAPPQRSLRGRLQRLLAEDKVISREIDLVFVISGHSSCSNEKIRLPPNVCVLTLSLLGDILFSGNGAVPKKVKELVKKSSSSSLPVSSFIDMAKQLRDDTKQVFPKVSGRSIRARCGSKNPKEQSTVTNQYFFGGTKISPFLEGIFMVEIPESLEQYRAMIEKMPMPKYPMPHTPPPVKIEDISSKLTPFHGLRLLTRSPHGDNPTPSGDNEYIYKKTTDVQKEIIKSESDNPNQTVLGSSVEFIEELANLYEQRRLFCMSLNFGDDFRSCVESCKGIDVMDLQRYYDLIVDWEGNHMKCAHDFFTQDDTSQVHPAIDRFIRDNALHDVQKTRDALIMLSEKRKMQREKFQIHMLYDGQLVQSLYQTESCENIVQNLHLMYPERKILIILDGCRVVYENREPYASEHGEDDDDELFNEEGQGGARRKKIKNANQRNKKTYKKKTYKKKTYKNKGSMGGGLPAHFHS